MIRIAEVFSTRRVTWDWDSLRLWGFSGYMTRIAEVSSTRRVTRIAEISSTRRVMVRIPGESSTRRVITGRIALTAHSCSARRVISLRDGFEIYRQV